LHVFRAVTQRQREKIRKQLIGQLTSIYRSVHGEVRESMVRELFDQDEPRDEGDESTRALMRDTRMSLAEADAQRAQLIEEALRRLSDGSYGKCIDCGGPIEPKRLEAVPWAIRCIEDQEAFEYDARDHSPSL
jgi:RNA polymerase-binding transcription factor